MEQSFVDDIKKKSSLVKFVINTDTASDIISYLYKETERQKSEIEQIKKKLAEMNSNSNNDNNNNDDMYNQLCERISQLGIQMDKKIEESNSRLTNLVKDQIKDIDFKTDVLSKRIGLGDRSPRSSFNDIYNQLNHLHMELQALKKNTSEYLGIEEDELSQIRTCRSSRKDQSNTICDTPESTKNVNLPSIPIPQSPSNTAGNKKERISLQEIADQIKQLREELNQQKELSGKLNTTRSSSRNQHIKKKEKEPLNKAKKFFKDAEVEVKIKASNDTEAVEEIDENREKKDNVKLEKAEKQEKPENQDNNCLKSEEFASLQQEIEKLKHIINDQTEKLKEIQETSKNGQISLDDYIQEILQSAMKCDTESQKLTNDYKNLQNLLINSLQEIKERMDSMTDQFTDLATKDEVMAAFSELINPKNPQNGTSIGVNKCKCLACGRMKPSVVTTTDSNLAEILHFHPLNSRNETYRPGAKVTLLNKDSLITSRSQKAPKDIMTPRRPKSSRS